MVSRRKLVWEAATLLRCCAVGGTAILRFGDIITTFAGGLIYILWRCFSKMLLVKPFTSCSSTSEVFLILVGRLPEAEPAGAEDGSEATDGSTIQPAAGYLLEVRLPVSALHSTLACRRITFHSVSLYL